MATYFDYSSRDYNILSLDILIKEEFNLDIFGNNFRRNKDAYTLGASFVSFLIDKYSKSKFLEFFAQNEYSENESFKIYYNKTDKELYEEWILYLKNS